MRQHNRSIGMLKSVVEQWLDQGALRLGIKCVLPACSAVNYQSLLDGRQFTNSASVYPLSATFLGALRRMCCNIVSLDEGDMVSERANALDLVLRR
jgi:hypothetical protein